MVELKLRLSTSGSTIEAPKSDSGSGFKAPASAFADVAHDPADSWAQTKLSAAASPSGSSFGSHSASPAQPKLSSLEFHRGRWHRGAQRARKVGTHDAPPALPHGAAGAKLLQEASLSTPVRVSEVRAESGDTYLITQSLAQGSQGKFRMAMKDGQLFGIKRYKLTGSDPQELADIEHEWRLAAQQSGMQVHDVIAVDNKLMFVTDLYSGNVAGENGGVARQKALDRVSPEKRAAYARGVMWHLARQLEELHGRSVVHRDVKPGNVLLGADGVVLADFGFAAELSEEGTAIGPSGTRQFVTREMMFGLPHNEKADVWSYAMTWFALHALPTPFNESKPHTVNALFAGYRLWHAATQADDGSGRVDLDKISDVPRSGSMLPDSEDHDAQRGFLGAWGDFASWDAWAHGAKAADAPMLEHMLNGPAHPDEARRSSMAEEVTSLRAIVSEGDLAGFKDVASLVRGSAAYSLRSKSSTDSGETSHSRDSIEEDLRAYSEALLGGKRSP